MTATQQTPPSPTAVRIFGDQSRLGKDPQISAWAPGSLAQVKALAPLPPPRRRGWELASAADIRPVPPAAEAASPAPSPAPVPARPALPENLQEASVQDIVMARPEDAAKLVRTMAAQDAQAHADGLDSINTLAILFVGLGAEASGDIIKYLSDFEAEEITKAIASVKGVAPELQRRILTEFKDHLLAGEWYNQGGMDFARSALERAVGPQKAAEIINRVASTVSSGFYMLKNVTPDQVAPFISNEHPQTIALILSQLDPSQAAGILGHLSERMQADVVYRITTMENVTPAVLKEIEESLEQNLRDILSGNQDVGGPKVAADILNLSSGTVEKNVLDQIDAQDPEYAEAVRNLMFVFADIAHMTDRDIQTLLREIDDKDLVMALKAAQEETRAKILGNLSQEARKNITDEMEFLGPMRLSEVEAVQLRIIQQVRQLEEQGKVTIVRGDMDDTLV